MDVSPSLDIDDLTDFLKVAEMAGGTLAVTEKGRLIIYGVDDPKAAAARINAPTSGAEYLVEAADGGTLVFVL